MKTLTHNVDALGTKCDLVALDGSPSLNAKDIFDGLLSEFDQVASRFRSDSELVTQFDGNGKKTVSVSPLLFDALTAAMRGANVSNGFVDPTLGKSIVSLGYDRDFELIAKYGVGGRELRFSLPVGYKGVKLDKSTCTVSVADGVRFDLGATGKAFLADRIRSEIERKLGESVLVNLGGDISASVLVNGRSWLVNLTEDGSLDPESSGLLIGLRGGGLATSSTMIRAWKIGSKSFHHILDPHSGTSANSEFYSVTVISGTALDANIASTGAIAMGEAGRQWLHNLRLPAMARGKYGNEYFGGWSPSIGERRCG